jgi:hypothetical protein
MGPEPGSLSVLILLSEVYLFYAISVSAWGVAYSCCKDRFEIMNYEVSTSPSIKFYYGRGEILK